MIDEIEALRGYRSVYAFMEYGEVATGLGFGSVAHSKELAQQMQLYERISFYEEDGTMNLIPCPRYTNDYFRRRGVRVDNSLQLVDGMLFLPSSYFCPLMAIGCEDGTENLTLYALEDHTLGIHLCDNSWKEEKDRAAFEKKKRELSAINKRLFTDWERSRKRNP